MRNCIIAVILALPGCAANPSIHDVVPTLAVVNAVTQAACLAPNLSDEVKKACQTALEAEQVASAAAAVVVAGVAK